MHPAIVDAMKNRFSMMHIVLALVILFAAYLAVSTNLEFHDDAPAVMAAP